jgi:hypothetical protein
MLGPALAGPIVCTEYSKNGKNFWPGKTRDQNFSKQPKFINSGGNLRLALDANHGRNRPPPA